MARLGIVIPTLNEQKNLEKLLPKLRQYFPSSPIIVVDDMSEKDDTREVAKKYGCVVPYTFKKRGFARSIREGFALATSVFNCYYVAQMDADHKAESLVELVKSLNSHTDLLLGVEKGERLTRTVSRFLSRFFLGLREFEHPTGGIRIWTKGAIEDIDLRHKKAHHFFEKVEMLYWAKRIGLKMAEVGFPEDEHRKTKMRTIFWWLCDFGFLFFRRITVHFWKDTMSHLGRWWVERKGKSGKHVRGADLSK